MSKGPTTHCRSDTTGLDAPASCRQRFSMSSWTQGSKQCRSLVWCTILVLTFGCLGCGRLLYRVKNDIPESFVPNPLELPPARDEFVWSQVIDAVDDYFRVAREQPVQNSEGIVLDGRVETAYRIGASIFEPWRKDSTAGFERMQSTFQSIRRRVI